MRLRRETGDFQIRINPSNGTNAIRTGLSAEDFAGELININGTIEPVLSVSESEGVVTAKTASYTVTYNKETGAITSSEGGAGGSGGGSGSGLTLPIEYSYDVDRETSFYKVPDGGSFPTGLAMEDLAGATLSCLWNAGSDEGRYNCIMHVAGASELSSWQHSNYESSDWYSPNVIIIKIPASPIGYDGSNTELCNLAYDPSTGSVQYIF